MFSISSNMNGIVLIIKFSSIQSWYPLSRIGLNFKRTSVGKFGFMTCKSKRRFLSLCCSTSILRFPGSRLYLLATLLSPFPVTLWPHYSPHFQSLFGPITLHISSHSLAPLLTFLFCRCGYSFTLLRQVSCLKNLYECDSVSCFSFAGHPLR